MDFLLIRRAGIRETSRWLRDEGMRCVLGAGVETGLWSGIAWVGCLR